MQQRILTGITATGSPHLGNYAGAIRPAIAASSNPDAQSFFFLADLHGLIKCVDPRRIERSRIEVAAAWLAAGLDTDRVIFYQQSDVPEIAELHWILTCVAAKGLMNRAHAYKAAIDDNWLAGLDADAGITMGLFCYPILMAADILLFSANKVPVGRDQAQHLEMTRDLAQRFNQLYSRGTSLLTLPEATVSDLPLLPGLDGRKMSKSYNNTIPLFSGGVEGLRASVSRIVTDSRRPSEPKDPASNSIFTLYTAFASDERAEAFRAELVEGIGWGEAKSRLVEAIECELAPMRQRYQEFIEAPRRVEELLREGADKARAIAKPFLSDLRGAMGLGRLALPSSSLDSTRSESNPSDRPQVRKISLKTKPPVLRQYRDDQGSYHFKLVGAHGRVLILGGPFSRGLDAGTCITRLTQPDLDLSIVPEIELGPGVTLAEAQAGVQGWRFTRTQ
jgi:tryptophanyl-tRNA synthetase